MARSSKSAFTLAADSPHVIDLANGRHGDPFAVLGRHAVDDGEVIRCFAPRTLNLWIDEESRPMERLPGTDLFEYRAAAGEVPVHYRVIRETDYGAKFARHDPYAFWPQLNVDETVSHLLEQLDGFSERGEVMVIAATNYEDMVDPAGLAVLDIAMAQGTQFAQLPVEPLPQAARQIQGDVLFLQTRRADRSGLDPTVSRIDDDGLDHVGRRHRRRAAPISLPGARGRPDRPWLTPSG